MLTALVCLVVWYILGCVVLCWHDHEDRRLFRWVQSCPVLGGGFITILLWPIVLWWYKRDA